MNRMTVYDQTRLCFKVTPHQEPGRSVIQELGIYEDIHEEEIKKARNITDIRDLYFTKGAKLDPYWENLGKPKTERSGWIPVSVLDKISAEIVQMPTISLNANDIYKADVLAIINKYKAESEEV